MHSGFPVTNTGQETLTVLVVESQEKHREALKEGLIRCGQQARAVASGREALDADMGADLVLLGLCARPGTPR